MAQPTFSLAYTSVRAAYVQNVIDLWRRTSTGKYPIEVVIAVDEDRPVTHHAASTVKGAKVVIQKETPFNCVKGWNLAAAHTTGKIIIADITVFGVKKTDECLRIAASLEQAVDHPIARAFNESCKERLTAIDLRVIPGAGVEGKIEGITYRLGKYDFAAGLANTNGAEDRVHIWLGSEQGIVARFEVSDSLRTEAKSTVQQLQQLGVRSVLLSGDSEDAVQSVASQSGINKYHARQLPADKVHVLEQLQKTEVTAMVGDGINDAPVLGAASVSIAMGGGTSLAQATADAVLMNNSLTVIPLAIRISRRARRIMKQNLWWAALYNLAAIPLAAMGLITPWLAAVGMSLSSILVVLNATRVLRVKPA